MDRPAPLKKSYLEWSNSLAQHYFYSSHAQQPVYLDVTRELIEEIGRRHRAGVDDFVAAAKSGPDWVQGGNVCQRAVASLKRWRRRNLDYPPYIGYLCLFTLAAGLEGDFHANAYYPRLRTLLGEEPVSGTYPHFHDVLEVWDDLETWSLQDKRGELGIFEVQVAGNHIYVGVPFAQTILSEQERHALPGILAEAGVDPRSLPADQELLRLFRVHGGGALRPRTRRLLENPQQDTELVAAMISVVRRVLATWDGTIFEYGSTDMSDGRTSQREKYGALRLTLRLDPVQGKAVTGLRCSLNQDFPDEGLDLDSSSLPTLHASEEIAGWSAPLRDASNSRPFDASLLDWRNGLDLKSMGWRFRLRASTLRIFDSGKSEGLPGYIESHRLQLGRSYLIACHRSVQAALLLWGAKCCDGGISNVKMVTGLPVDWVLYRTGIVRASARVSEDLQPLALSNTPRLRLKGGIRQERGNRFFAFAPPALEIEDGDGTIEVFYNDQQLAFDSTTRRYLLPPDIPVNQVLEAEARKGEETIARVRFTLETSSAWNVQGNMATSSAERFIPPAPPGSEAGWWYVALPSRWHIGESTELYLLGSTPGQIIRWIERHNLRDWSPVWAVKQGRHGFLLSVSFCADGFLLPDSSARQAGTSPDIDRWKSLFCHPPARTRLPSCSAVQYLWAHYREYAASI